MLMNEDEFGVPIPDGDPVSYVLIVLLVLTAFLIMYMWRKNNQYLKLKKDYENRTKI